MCNEAVTYRCGACWTSVPLLFAAAARAAPPSQPGKPSAASIPRALPMGRGKKIKTCSPPALRDLLPWRCVCVPSRRSSACAQRRSARQPPVHSHFPSNDSVAPLKPQHPDHTCQVLLTASTKRTSSSLKIQTCGSLSWRRHPRSQAAVPGGRLCFWVMTNNTQPHSENKGVEHA